MGNRKEYISIYYGKVTYDPDVLDLQDVKEMDKLASAKSKANKKFIDYSDNNVIDVDDYNRLQRIIDHSERVYLVYDPTDPYLNSTIDPLVKPSYYLNAMAGIAGWDVRYSKGKENKKQYKVSYFPPVEGIDPIIIEYDKEDKLDYAYFEPFIIQFLDINKKLMDSAVEV